MDTSKSERNAILAEEIARHTGYLQRYARSRVRDEHLAEEAVQDTLVAALESLDSFDGRATLRTWLTGILLHKIHDGFRRATRHEAPEGELPEPVEWLTPDHSLHVKRLCGAFMKAVRELPERQATAFMMSEISETGTEAICRALGVSRGNAWVLIHRAKASLRGALGTMEG
jgi:RNA polymerase sigma-70 factor (ECF subfamily)